MNMKQYKNEVLKIALEQMKKKYVICEKIGENFNSIRNDFGFISVFNNKLDADIERIYLQPDYVNRLIVKEG